MDHYLSDLILGNYVVKEGAWHLMCVCGGSINPDVKTVPHLHFWSLFFSYLMLHFIMTNLESVTTFTDLIILKLLISHLSVI